MELVALRSRRFRLGDLIEERLFQALRAARLRIRNHDIIAVASKVVSLSEGRTVSLARVEPSFRAEKLGERFKMPSDFAQVVLDEADAVYGGVPGVLLTLKKGNAVPNSGVDRKNAPDKSVVSWPTDPQRSAERLLRLVRRRSGKNVGVVIVDSRVTPLRLGTVGLAIACSGFQPVLDYRGVKDLYGRKVQLTLQAYADGIAAAAHLLMGEARESVPFVLVRGARIPFDMATRPVRMTIPVRDCLFLSQIAHPFISKDKAKKTMEAI